MPPTAVFVGVAVVVVMSAGVGVLSAGAVTPAPPWPSASAVALPSPAANPAAALESVACASAGNCVAVGNYNDGSSNRQAMVVGESGGVWSAASAVALPAHATNPEAILNSVACASAGNCVAVGNYNDASSDDQAMVVGESDGVWGAASPVALPSHATNPNAVLGSVACPSAGNCVAVGYYTDASSNRQAMVVGESGGVWGAASPVALPSPATNPFATLYSVACASAGNCVAVGEYYDASSAEQAMVVGESGGVWSAASAVALPAHATNPRAELHSVACPSAGNCVAGGFYNDASSNRQAMVVGESGGVPGAASEVALPAAATNPDAGLTSVACASAGNCVAVGGYNDAASDYQAMVVGESGGVWGAASPVALPSHATNPNAVLYSVACPSAGNCVAGGQYYDAASDEQAMAVGESGGVWGAASAVALPAHATNPYAVLRWVACANAGNCVAVGDYNDASSAEQAMVVGSVASLALSTSGLPSALVGSAYSAQLAASGGVGNYTWSLSSGALPAGLTLNAASGLISGTPTASGTASFTIAVSDPGPPGQQVSVALSIAVGGSSTAAVGRSSIAAVKTNGPKVTVTVSCGAAASLTCTGTLALTTLEHLSGHTITAITATKKPKQTTRTITLAKATYSVAGSTSKALTIKLNAAARQLLAKHHKLPAELTVTPTGTTTATATANVTIRPGKPKKRRHR